MKNKFLFGLLLVFFVSIGVAEVKFPNQEQFVIEDKLKNEYHLMMHKEKVISILGKADKSEDLYELNENLKGKYILETYNSGIQVLYFCNKVYKFIITSANYFLKYKELCISEMSLESVLEEFGPGSNYTQYLKDKDKLLISYRTNDKKIIYFEGSIEYPFQITFIFDYYTKKCTEFSIMCSPF